MVGLADNIEAQVGPLIGHLGALKVSDETGPTGSHDQFAPSSENTPYNDSRYATHPLPAVEPPENRPTSYSEKISTTTTAIAGTAVMAKDAIAEKLGYGSKDGRGQKIKAGQEETTTATVKIEETLAPVYEKVTGMGTTVASKISGDAAGKEATVEVGSSKNSLLGKLWPGDEDRALCEVISNVLHRKKDHEAEEAVEPETTKQVGELSGDGRTARSGSVNMVDRIKVAVTSFFVKGGDGGAGHGRLQEEGMEKREEGRLEEISN